MYQFLTLLSLPALHNISSFFLDDEPRMKRKCLASRRCWKVVDGGFARGGNLDSKTRMCPGHVGGGTRQVITLGSVKSSASRGTPSGEVGGQVFRSGWTSPESLISQVEGSAAWGLC